MSYNLLKKFVLLRRHSAMDRKRQPKVSTVEAKPYSMWRTKPPGPEQLELEKMFKSNMVSPSSTADSVRQSNKLFHQFSAAVFGNHFRETKARLGHCAKVSATRDANAGNDIPELGGEQSNSPDSPTFEPEQPSSIAFSNPPYWVWKYFDHMKNLELICVAVLAFSGIRNVDFEIAEDGMTLYIHYVWPSAIYRIDELFQKAKNEDGTPLSMNHPKVHAFVANTLDNGVSRNSMPRGKIVIQLPEKVQRIPNTYRIEAMAMGDANIIHIEFSAHHKSAVIEEADRSIVFK